MDQEPNSELSGGIIAALWMGGFIALGIGIGWWVALAVWLACGVIGVAYRLRLHSADPDYRLGSDQKLTLAFIFGWTLPPMLLGEHLNNHLRS